MNFHGVLGFFGLFGGEDLLDLFLDPEELPQAGPSHGEFLDRHVPEVPPDVFHRFFKLEACPPLAAVSVMKPVWWNWPRCELVVASPCG